jgi:hypothetical protein
MSDLLLSTLLKVFLPAAGIVAMLIAAKRRKLSFADEIAARTHLRGRSRIGFGAALFQVAVCADRHAHDWQSLLDLSVAGAVGWERT